MRWECPCCNQSQRYCQQMLPTRSATVQRARLDKSSGYFSLLCRRLKLHRRGPPSESLHAALVGVVGKGPNAVVDDLSIGLGRLQCRLVSSASTRSPHFRDRGLFMKAFTRLGHLHNSLQRESFNARGPPAQTWPEGCTCQSLWKRQACAHPPQMDLMHRARCAERAV